MSCGKLYIIYIINALFYNNLISTADKMNEPYY